MGYLYYPHNHPHPAQPTTHDPQPMTYNHNKRFTSTQFGSHGNLVVHFQMQKLMMSYRGILQN